MLYQVLFPQAINTTLKVTTTGSGNVVTSISKTSDTITVTKGMNALQASDLENLTLVCGFAN